MERVNSLFTIGQFAKFNGISEQTLRYYDRIGLLTPATQNPQTGYRYYTISQCGTLDIINHMKALGFSLKEIKAFLETNNQAWLLDSLSDKQKELESEIRRLNSTYAVITRKIQEYNNYASLPKSGIPFIEAIPQRTIYRYDTGINYYYNEDSEANYEHMLHFFKGKLHEQQVPDEYYYNVSSIMHMDNLVASNYVTTELFVFVSSEDRYRFEACETIPANCFLCIICDDCKNEIAYISRMMQEIEKNGYIICGDYICEVVSEFFSTKEDRRSMILKLQVPIKFY